MFANKKLGTQFLHPGVPFRSPGVWCRLQVYQGDPAMGMFQLPTDLVVEGPKDGGVFFRRSPKKLGERTPS